jgi:hypothetical protein
MEHSNKPAPALDGAIRSWASRNWETLREASQRCNVSARHMRGLMATGVIPWYRVGKRRIVLDPAEVDQAIREQFRGKGAA